MSVDFDLASIQVAKSSFNVSQGFKHSLSFSGTPVKFFREVRVGRIQEFHVIPFVQVQDELADVLEAHLRSAVEKGNDFSFRIRFISHIHSPPMPLQRYRLPRPAVPLRLEARPADSIRGRRALGIPVGPPRWRDSAG